MQSVFVCMIQYTYTELHKAILYREMIAWNSEEIFWAIFELKKESFPEQFQHAKAITSVY